MPKRKGKNNLSTRSELPKDKGDEVLVNISVHETLPKTRIRVFDSFKHFIVSELNLDNLAGLNTKHAKSEGFGEGTSLDLLLNFIKLPWQLETFMTFGLFYYCIVFIHWLIVIPLRCFIHVFIESKRLFRKKNPRFGGKRMLVFKNDLITIVCLSLTMLQLLKVDTSKIYHNIRAGTAIKLFFMVQVLEIFDRLLSSSGIDILKLVYNDNFFNHVTTVNSITFCFALGLTVVYLWFHCYVLIYQVMALNVAINSYSNALLTMILSNQFSELKSAVFKRTEREGLFQITCADLNERFFLLIMLIIISSRNLLQICMNSSSIHDLFNNIKPNSWQVSNFTSNSKFIDDWFGLLLGPCVVVLGTEVMVDWVKHTYISRFNRINHKIYHKFNSILSKDLISEFQDDKFSNLIIKRTGFPIFAVIIVFIKLSIFPWLNFIWEKTYSFPLILVVSLFCGLGLLIVKYLFSLLLLRWSGHISPESANDFLRGVPNTQLSQISDIRLNLYSDDEKVPLDGEQKRLAKKKPNLEQVVRFEMADKKIW